MVCRDVESSFQ